MSGVREKGKVMAYSQEWYFISKDKKAIKEYSKLAVPIISCLYYGKCGKERHWAAEVCSSQWK